MNQELPTYTEAIQNENIVIDNYRSERTLEEEEEEDCCDDRHSFILTCGFVLGIILFLIFL